MNTKEKLVVTYSKMSEHTKDICAHKCRVPHSCCSPEYCDMAISIAKEDWGVQLKATPQYEEGRTKFPLMGLEGCVASPHFRPLCTFHNCAINGVGFTQDKKWDKAYFKLRSQIDKLEWEKRNKQEA